MKNIQTTFVLLSYFILCASGIYAQHMESDEFQVEIQEAELDTIEEIETQNTEGQEAEREETTPTPGRHKTVPQSKHFILSERERAIFEEQGYIIRNQSDNQAQHNIQLTLSQTNVVFKELEAQKPNTQTIDIRLSSRSPIPFQTYILKKEPFQSIKKSTIEETLCTDKQPQCSLSQARPWTSSKIYGAGYNMQGQSVPQDFVDETYFRPFPAEYRNDVSRIIMSGIIEREESGQLNIKTHIPPSFPGGSYTTTIQIVTLPQL